MSVDTPFDRLRSATASALARGKGREAQRLSHQLMDQHPDKVDTWKLSAECKLRIGDLNASSKAIQQALTLEPQDPLALAFYADVLLKGGELERSLRVARQLLALNTSDTQALNKLGYVLTTMQRYGAAKDCFERAANLEPGKALHQFNLGTALRTSGELAQAEQCFDKAIALNPKEYESFYARSGLRRQTPESNHIDELESLLTKPTRSWRRRVHIHFALAKEYDDLQQYNNAFTHLEQGNALRRQQLRYDVRIDEEKLGRIQAAFNASVFQDKPASSGTDRPIFVLGLPRSGSTLVDRILSSHSQVVSVGELPNFGDRMVRLAQYSGRAAPLKFDQLLSASKQIDFLRLGRDYLDSTDMYAGDSPRFVDKLPFNFLYIGLIHLTFPNAAIVHIHKNPLDACLGIYRILFQNAYPYAYDLNELSRYWIAYRQLMDHWDAVLPGRVFNLAYEDLVANPSERIRDLLDYCSLEWEERCEAFHTNPEVATTASAVQVRQPIHRGAVGHWKHYEQHLGPAIKHFEQHGYL